MPDNLADFAVLSGPSAGPLVRWQAAVAGFSDGFLGGVLGGALYRLLLGQWPALGLECTWGRIVLFSALLGCLAAWRAARRKGLEAFNWRITLLLAVSALSLWVLDVFAGAPAPPVLPPLPRLEYAAKSAPDLLQRGVDRRTGLTFRT